MRSDGIAFTIGLQDAQARQDTGGSSGGRMRFSANRLFSFAIVLTALLCGAGGAGAADLPIKPAPMALPPQPPVEAWQFTVMPYFWAPSLNGTSTIRGRTADVDVTFLDMVEHSQIPKDLFGVMTYLEARKGQWSFFSDLVYVRLAASRSGFRERSLAPGVSGEIAASAEASVEMFIGEAAAAYEITRFGTPGSQSAVDVYAGIRGWWQEASASLAVQRARQHRGPGDQRQSRHCEIGRRLLAGSSHRVAMEAAIFARQGIGCERRCRRVRSGQRFFLAGSRYVQLGILQNGERRLEGGHRLPRASCRLRAGIGRAAI